MEAHKHFAYGITLIQRHFFREAEQEFRKALTQSPNNARAHAMLAMALSAQNKSKEAVAEARQSVRLAPDLAYAYYILSMTLFHADQIQEARAAINEALRLDPNDSDYYELLGRIYAAKGNWQSALDSAQGGLSIDPQNIDCANLEAISLVHLGRRVEARMAIEHALQLDPENASTHAHLGWADLHAGKHQDALVHFREALRLNPNLEWARSGIIEAMKARNILYRPILAYCLWMSRLSSQVRLGLMGGLWVVFRILSKVAQVNSELNPILLPIIGVYLLFMLMTWIANPLFNLFLRLDKFGRMALSAEEITTSTWLGVCVFGGLGLLLAGILAQSTPLVLAGIGLFAMSVLVVSIFHGKSHKGRRILSTYAIGLAVIAALAALLGLMNSPIALLIAAVFILGWSLYFLLAKWVANLK